MAHRRVPLLPSLHIDAQEPDAERGNPQEHPTGPPESNVPSSPIAAQDHTGQDGDIFSGDFFGDDYREEDFPGWHEGDRGPVHNASGRQGVDNSEDSDDDGEGNDEEVPPRDRPDVASDRRWEPEPAPYAPPSPMLEDFGLGDDDDLDPNFRSTADGTTSRAPAVVIKFGGAAGKIYEGAHGRRTGYDTYSASVESNTPINPYAPFTSRMDWEIARWAKLQGPGSTSVSSLLGIDNLSERLALSYKNSVQLNQIIDTHLPTRRPRFRREEIVVEAAQESFDIYFRDVLDCVKALFGDPEFAPHLVFAPEKHFADEEHKERLYHDMHTGRWWWATQEAVERNTPGATIVPIIISSDKTQLTLFRNKSAYPVYMTIGNIPKDIRRKPSRQAQILLAYLPTTRLQSIPNDASRRRTLANLFHAAMGQILQPLEKAGREGVQMTSGSGEVRRCHPIYAIFVGDYPEQVLVTCVKYGDCPVCPTPRDELGSGTPEPLRGLDSILDALGKADEHPSVFAKACLDAGIKPVYHPFWQHLPYVNIYRSITPDILHQLYQGLIKHLVAWLISAFGDAEIDARCRRMPPSHHARLFSKGISSLSRVTGQEHRDMCRILLGLIVDLRLPGGQSPLRLVRCVRALLDFLYLAQYKVHSTETLKLLKDARTRFHANKSIFIDLGIRTHFNFPKLHFADHYEDLIEAFGTTDNYNTQTTERLHIDFVKDAYEATNHKDEYVQMTIWLERKEKILLHERYIRWRLAGSLPGHLSGPSGSAVEHFPHIRLTKRPSTKLLSFDDIAKTYGAVDIINALCDFIAPYRDPLLTGTRLQHAAADLRLPFNALALYHKIRFSVPSPQPWLEAEDVYDVAHVRPGYTDSQDRDIESRFDAVLVNLGVGGDVGVKGMCCRIR
ncbi:hypothetical protein EUX98_g1491 [Antrodiella citrinella]|uniref:DUF6830 domain-containing protein n=1 Tax=Antrodiella citrinella TaxID=2447956 RepID=A0A4S4N1C1_9APHY|nr:hypothetical protein EUX98_g1491 [Antrodiella citrinella]